MMTVNSRNQLELLRQKAAASGQSFGTVRVTEGVSAGGNDGHAEGRKVDGVQKSSGPGDHRDD